MKNENVTRQTGTPTTKKEAESRDNKQYCISNRMNVSETGIAFLKLTGENMTPQEYQRRVQ